MTRIVYYVEHGPTAIVERESSCALRSHVYICSTCGTEWARIACEPAGAWEAHSLPCRKHRPQGVWDWSATPGALTNTLCEDPPVWDEARKIANLPKDVLRWELLREIDNLERGEA